jgi:hypothetical protein
MICETSRSKPYAGRDGVPRRGTNSENSGDQIAPNELVGLLRMEATKLAEASDDDIAVMKVGWTNVGG